MDADGGRAWMGFSRNQFVGRVGGGSPAECAKGATEETMDHALDVWGRVRTEVEN